MRITFKSVQSLCLVGLVALASPLLTGCEQVRAKVAELIAPQPPAETLQTVNRLIEDGKYQEAKDQAAPRADQADAPMRGEFAFATARASALKGDKDAALRYLALAMQHMELPAEVAMGEPAFVSLRTELGFLQLLTQDSPAPRRSSQAAPAAPERVTEIGAGDTRIRQDSKGTEIRAGDVVIKLPN